MILSWRRRRDFSTMRCLNDLTVSPFKYVHQLNHSRPDGDENQGGHHEQDEGNDHFNSSLGSLLFGALPAFGTQGFGVNA